MVALCDPTLTGNVNYLGFRGLDIQDYALTGLCDVLISDVGLSPYAIDSRPFRANIILKLMTLP